LNLIVIYDHNIAAIVKQNCRKQLSVKRKVENGRYEQNFLYRCCQERKVHMSASNTDDFHCHVQSMETIGERIQACVAVKESAVDRSIRSREFRLMIGASGVLRAFTLFLQLCGSPRCGSFLRHRITDRDGRTTREAFSRSRIRDLVTNQQSCYLDAAETLRRWS